MLDKKQMDSYTIERICDLLKIDKKIFVGTKVSEAGRLNISTKENEQNQNQYTNLLAQLDAKDELILAFRVPESKAEQIKSLVNKKLEGWKNKKKIKTSLP